MVATSGPNTEYGFVRSAALLIASVLGVALLLLPVAMHQTGSGNTIGLAMACGICLASGIAAEVVGYLFSRSGVRLFAHLAGMLVRMLLPLGICLILAVRGFSGRENIVFVCYLLALYSVNLALETGLAVTRTSSSKRALHPTAN